MATNKEMAIDFLKMVVAGKIDEAYGKYVDMNGLVIRQILYFKGMCRE